ncbi:MAG: endonuclease III domain-containing protein [Candidatus Babeliales bacterium]
MIEPAASSIVKQYGQDPFLVLVSCLLSLRTKDTVSLPASIRLFEHARTPEQLRDLPLSHIEKLIYPTGFYKRKAQGLKYVSDQLITRFHGKVPNTFDDLISIKGIGPKTANLVLAEGFGIPAICVDTHVHRISNRLGLVSTKTPEETERALKELLPQEYWAEYNTLIVTWGQNICVPISPFCSKCPLFDVCPKIGVTKRR